MYHDAPENRKYCSEKGKLTNVSQLKPSMAEFATVIADSGSTVNMRSKARSTAALVERVPLGARVEVLGTCGSWTKVKFGSRTGYMMTKFPDC